MSREISSTLKHTCQNEMAPYTLKHWNYTQIQGFFIQDGVTVLHIGTVTLTSFAPVTLCR